MVAKEARKAHSMEKKLEVVETRLEEEQAQLKELKTKMEELITEQEEHSHSKRHQIQSDEEVEVDELDFLDSVQLKVFEDFVAQAPFVKMQKIHSIPFMRTCSDDDVEPCLRFGWLNVGTGGYSSGLGFLSGSRITSKKLVESMLNSNCLVEGITEKDHNLASPTLSVAGRESPTASFSMTADPGFNPTASCSLCNRPGPCKFKLSTNATGDHSPQWTCVCHRYDY